MLKDQRGFTLTEVIIAIALIGIIAVGLLPAFSNQYRMTVNARKLTTTGFEAQGEIEKQIGQVKEVLRSPESDEIEKVDFEDVFGKQIRMTRVDSKGPSSLGTLASSTNKSKNYTLYLSKKLAQMEYRNPLSLETVRIDEEKEGTTTVIEGVEAVNVGKDSDLKRIVGYYKLNQESSQDLNIYRWYISKEGLSDPSYPEDFIYNPKWRSSYVKKEELKEDAENRYVVLVVIPADKSGLRGDEMPSPKVYIQGEEWRADLFAWIDKLIDGIRDGIFVDKEDIKLEDDDTSRWVLLGKFNTQEPFEDLAYPGTYLDGSDGSLYVPMGVRRSKPQNQSGTIQVEGAEVIDWQVDESIYFANNIIAENNTDIIMKTQKGNIGLYQFVEINDKGEAVFDGAKVQLIEAGATIKGPNISLEAGKNIILQPYTQLEASSGQEGQGQLVLTAKEDIIAESSQLTAKVIILESKGKDGLTRIKDTSISASNLDIQSDTEISGGGWTAARVKVADDKVLSLKNIEKATGVFDLGNTGGVKYEGGWPSFLESSLNLSLDKGTDSSTVQIATNYGRNVAYAGPKDKDIILSGGVMQKLGSGSTNLEYRVEKVSGEAIVDLAYSFDGKDTIKIGAESNLNTDNDKEMTAYSNDYILYVGDQYAEGIIGSIKFRVKVSEDGQIEVEVDPEENQGSGTFPDIGTGEYVSIGGDLFQKVSDNQLLKRSTIRDGEMRIMEWNKARELASAYGASLNTEWVIFSGLIEKGMAESLNENNILTLDRTEIDIIHDKWWLATRADTEWVERAYFVDENGKTYNNNEPNVRAIDGYNRCRPFIQVSDPRNLYITGGDGSKDNPYTLSDIAPSDEP